METEAAQSLINRALRTDSQSIAYLLIDTAHRLDNSIDTKKIKREWINQWLQKEYQKMIDQQRPTQHPKP